MDSQQTKMLLDEERNLINEYQPVTFSSSPYRFWQFKHKYNGKDKELYKSSSESELLEQDSKIDQPKNDQTKVQLQYLISMRNQSKDELNSLFKQVKSLKNKLSVCEEKINVSMKKNQHFEKSLKQIKKTITTQSMKNISRKSIEQGNDKRYIDLGKFVRKNTSRQSRKREQYKSPDLTEATRYKKPTQSSKTQRNKIYSGNDYCEITEKRVQKKMERKKYKQQIKSLKRQLDNLIYQDLKTKSSETKKQLRKKMKEITKSIQQLESLKKAQKCECKLHKIPSEFMKF